jgi:predicted permease
MGSTSKPIRGVFILAGIICALVLVPLLSAGGLGRLSTLERTAKITEIVVTIFIPAVIAHFMGRGRDWGMGRLSVAYLFLLAISVFFFVRAYS